MASVLLAAVTVAPAQVAVRGKTVHTMAGAPINDGIVVIQDGKITAIGRRRPDRRPAGLSACSKPPLSRRADRRPQHGRLLGHSEQPARSGSARSAPRRFSPSCGPSTPTTPHEDLIEWIRSFGVTTIHTGHAPGELISGQTLIAKTTRQHGGRGGDRRATRRGRHARHRRRRRRAASRPAPAARSMAMLRAELIKAREYQEKQRRGEATAKAERKTAAEAAEAEPDEASKPRKRAAAARPAAGNARQRAEGELPLMITTDRAQDIASALRLAKEFNIKLWLDGAAEAYLAHRRHQGGRRARDRSSRRCTAPSAIART